MEPLTLLLNAVIAGAAAALKPAAENAVKDTYNALKEIIKQRWNRVAIDHIEGDPTSKARQAALEEDLQKTGAFRDPEVLRQAQQVIAVVNQSDAAKAAAAAAGISIEKLKAGASIHLEDLISTGSVKVGDLRAKKNLTIRGVHSGNPPVR